MKTAIILHGMPSKDGYENPVRDAQSNSHWLPWIQQQLLTKGILAQTPELPEPYMPVYESWKKEFERFDVNDETILIGHSCGAGFLVRWLSENKVKVGKVVLVAPWIDVEHELKTGFFDFEIDPLLPSRTKLLAIISSLNDDKAMLVTTKLLAEYWSEQQITYMENMGHFCLEDMNTREFPELLRILS